MCDMKDFTAKLVRLLGDQSQRKFAAKFGANKDKVNRWFKGESEPGLEDALRIARYFDVSLDYLIDDEIKEPPRGLSEDQRTLLDLARRFGEGELLAFVSDKIGDLLRERGLKAGFLKPGLLESASNARRKSE